MNTYSLFLVFICFLFPLGCEDKCTSDVNCEDGYHCTDRGCEMIDKPVCEAGVMTCDGENTLIRCNAEGTEREVIACGEMETCVSENNEASCQVQVCEPNTMGCEDEGTTFICDSTGTERQVLSCEDGMYCSEGNCRAQICMPSSQSCDGAFVVACDGLGSSQTVMSCIEGCESEVGCGCDSGMCYEQSCQPGSTRCTGNSVQVCEEDGRNYGMPMACGAEEVCVQGSCVSSTCNVGTQICAGDVVLTCNENGTERMEENCSAQDKICVESGDGAACQERVCLPNSQICVPGEEIVLSCDARGAVEMRASCQTGTFCRDGVCVDALCNVEDGLSCIDGDVKRCNERGSEYLLVQECTGEERCRNGACLPLNCEAGSVSCSGETLLTCSADGLTLEQRNCAEESAYCDSMTLACVSQVCAPGGTYCEGNVLMFCDNRGSSSMMEAECLLGCDAGTCVEGCGDGIVQEGEECDGGEGCDETCVFENTAPCVQSELGCPTLDFVMINGGTFEMGSTVNPNEQPVHSVTVSNFEIMRTEVTVTQYKTCVDAGVCTAPRMGTDFNWRRSGRENHPVNGVSWVQMKEFAAWVGARLPSEAEWEYAARSEGQNIIYPWGNTIPTCSYADFRDNGVQCNGVGTSPVCNTSDGNSMQGLCDMAGNVFEWTLDNWHETYNGAPIDGSAWCDSEGCENNRADRVYRGGDWLIGGSSSIRAAYRLPNTPSLQSNRIGARLSRSVR